MAENLNSPKNEHSSKRLFGLSPRNVTYRSQLVAFPYFVTAGLLLLAQIIFGLFLAAQYVWPTFLINSLPFNINRETHLNLLILWLLLGLMGATYYLIPEEARSKLFSVKLAVLQWILLLIAAVGTLISFWFFRSDIGSLGKPFTESPYPWPYFIALGAVIFLVNIGVTLIRARRWTPISGILFAGMAGISILYMIDMIFFPNLTIDFYWWWWIIHLWVEGAWELVAAAVMAFLLIRITGVEKRRLYRWLYLEVILVLFTGILGTGHHYYWIGTPAYWLTIGAVFSAFEPIPILLMVIDALRDMRHRGREPVNRVAWYWLGGSAILHFFGAGIYGFAQTLPQINKWTHGTHITATHGHFAFFGAFAMLVLGAIYYIVPKMKGSPAIKETRGKWAFWLMTGGLLVMIVAWTIAGIVQVYLWRIIGLDFMTVKLHYVSFWMFFVWFFGLVAFLPGVLVFLWDFFSIKSGNTNSGNPHHT